MNKNLLIIKTVFIVIIAIELISKTHADMWTQSANNAQWSPRTVYSPLAHNGKMYIIGGDASRINDVWNSSDGCNWECVNPSAFNPNRSNSRAVEFNNKIWVVGGEISIGNYLNDVLYSENGSDWTRVTSEAPWSARAGHAAIVFNGKIWLIGGYDNGFKKDVWYSENGTDWTCATSSAPWEARSAHSAVVHNGKIWVLGGATSPNTLKNDVWYSDNGIDWVMATATAPWSTRLYFSCVSFQNNIWVIGGWHTSETNDVWYSSNGIDWVQATKSAPWSPRNGHGSTVFDNRIWVLGGGDVYKNDVWFSYGLTEVEGSIIAWGRNDYGQCIVPYPNNGKVNVVASYYNSYGLKINGAIVPWGDNNYNQCNIPYPNNGFVAIAGGWHCLGIKANGSLVSWGRNDYGQCNLPTPNSGFRAVAVGDYHSLGLKTDGSIIAWGQNDYGQCEVPSPNSNFTSVAAGAKHSLGLKEDGTVVAWGLNDNDESNEPPSNSNFIAIAAGYYHNLGIKADGSIVAWGLNNRGQCDVPSPNSDFIAVAAGYEHSLALKRNGSIVAWGSNNYGQCSVPMPNSGFESIAAGTYHSLGLVRPKSSPSLYVYPSASYNTTLKKTGYRCRVKDAVSPDLEISNGTVFYTLQDSEANIVDMGTLYWAGTSIGWIAEKTFTNEGLSPGTYSVQFSAQDLNGRTGFNVVSLIVEGRLVTIQGIICDSSSGSFIQDAQVALFDGAKFWDIVMNNHNGEVPDIVDLIAELTPLRQSLSDSDGKYSWDDIPSGGSYVILASKESYHQAYTGSFPAPADVETIEKNLSLVPEGITTFEVLLPELNTLKQASFNLMDRNILAMVDLSKKVKDSGHFRDKIFTQGFGFAADVMEWISIVNSISKLVTEWGNGKFWIDIMNEIDPNSLDDAIDAVIKSQRISFLYGFSQINLDVGLNAINNHAKDEFIAMGQEPKIDFNWYRQTQSTYTDTVNAVTNRWNDFLSNTISKPIPVGFDIEKARQMLRDHSSLIDQQTPEHTVYIIPPDPSISILKNRFPEEYRGYLTYDNYLKQIVVTENILSGVSIVASCASIALAPTGVGGVVLFAVSTGASAAKYISVQEQKQTIYLLGKQFGSSLDAYQNDNVTGGLVLSSALDLIDKESDTLKYMKNNTTFKGSSEVDLNLPIIPFTDMSFMYTMGIPGFGSIGHGVATAHVKDDSSALHPIDYRLSAFGVWSPTTILSSMSFSKEELVTSLACNRFLLNPKDSLDVALPFTGYSRNFYSSITKPHYFTLETFVGPYRMTPVIKSYLVFDLGQPLITLGYDSSRRKTPNIISSENNVISFYSTKDHQIPLKELIMSSDGSYCLLDSTLNATSSTIQINLQASSDLYTLDLKLFAPQEEQISILLSDTKGNRLGYSSNEGIFFYELLGSITNMGQRPISIRVLDPLSSETYTIAVSLLSPGPRDVPISLFYEPVKKSGAIMTAFPSPVILDGDLGTTQSLLIRIGEASEQQALTNVKAKLGTIEKWGGGSTLPSFGESDISVGVIPAAEQRYVSWNVDYPYHSEYAKYTGILTLSSSETADLILPLVALARASTETISLYEGPSTDTATMQKTLTFDTNGKAETWVHIPKDYGVLYAALGLVGASENLMNPTLDIGGDGVQEWAFSGEFDLGVLVNHIEDAFNDYMNKHEAISDGWNVPIEVSGPPNEKIMFNGIQLYLDKINRYPNQSELVDYILRRSKQLIGDINGDGKIDVADLITLILGNQ
jgi:hypothetical protein